MKETAQRPKIKTRTVTIRNPGATLTFASIVENLITFVSRRSFWRQSTSPNYVVRKSKTNVVMKKNQVEIFFISDPGRSMKSKPLRIYWGELTWLPIKTGHKSNHWCQVPSLHGRKSVGSVNLSVPWDLITSRTTGLKTVLPRLRKVLQGWKNNFRNMESSRNGH